MALASDNSAVIRAGLATELPDDIVVARVRRGDTALYEIIIRRHNRRLYRAVRSILRDDDEAQDAMQEAYVRAYTHLDGYREQGNFAAWLTRIAVNEALMRKRKDRRFVPLDTPAAPDEEDTVHTDERFHTTTPEGLAGGGELRRLIENAVDRLPDGFRAVFVLRAIEQLSVNEVAACLDIPEATVRTRFHRAREMMRRDLDRHIDAAGLSAFDFAGARCDRMVATVLARLLPSG
jgi:RNA polymerase sigma-70 factor (ECF subfamily)